MNTVLEYIKSNPGATKTSIGETCGMKGLQLHNLLLRLTKDGQIKPEGEGYTIIEAIGQAVEETRTAAENMSETNEQLAQKDNSPTAEEPAKPIGNTSKGTAARNNDKFSFKGQDGLGKGPLCREFLKAVVVDNPGITMKKLNELVPQSLIPRFGLYEEVEAARKISGQKYDRYFFKEEHVIKLKDKKIVVCNQLTSQLLSGVIAKAKELGYKIS